MVNSTMPWMILFLPLCAAITIGFWTQAHKLLSAAIALSSVLGSLILTYFFYVSNKATPVEISIDWIQLPILTLQFGLLFNPLSFAMSFIVLIVSALVFYYSIEYMENDPAISRYFSFLSLFVFSMLGIVLSNNLFQLFIFWELVGVSSYLLIGFWYQKNSAADAGKKAFLTNRLGDYGFLLGIILLWTTSHTLNLYQLSLILNVPQPIINESLITISALLIFCGVIGKSGQFPLHVWLPDAMEGPTPVSALIHAATMVAAGIYLLARTFFIFHASQISLEVIAYLGGFTAIFAASQAFVQTDIKRVLAYSTLSQLGYMVMAVGLGSSAAAMYHLTTHAFFKALLFLCAGAVIHASHEQDMMQMGSFFKKLPVTGICFIIGGLALAGIYPLSGFWSKDEILSLAYTQNQFLFWVSLVTAFLTAFYITRSGILIFFGKKSEKPKIHEPKQWMTIPMIILTILSISSGWFGFDRPFLNSLDEHVLPNSYVALLSSFVALTGIFFGIFFYQIKPNYPGNLKTAFHGIYHVLKRGYFIDAIYNWFLENIQKPFAELCSAFEQKIIVERLVNGTALIVSKTGDTLRKLQTGRIQTYTTVFFGGIIILLYIFLLRGAL